MPTSAILPRCQSYERLEFLGDSILGIVTADFLYHHEPELPEGRMTRLRAELVCETSLHKVALELGISEYMRLGRGEEHTGGRQRPSILADMVEAIIAAMYIDSGMDRGARVYNRPAFSRTQRSTTTTARRITRPSFRSLCSAAAISISAMSLSARAAPTTARPLRFRSASTGFPSARAAAERRRKPSSRPPAERWRR